MNDYKVSDRIRLSELTPEAAWSLGFFAADGSLVIPTREHEYPRVSFTIGGTDKEVLEKLRTYFGCDHPVREYFEPKHVAQLAFTSTYYTELLKGLQLKERFPECFMDEHLNRHFIRGLFDGDGCLHKRKRHGIMSVFVNERESIVRDVAYSLNKYLFLSFKTPKHVPDDHLYRIQYESRSARLFMWYLYHGETEHMSLSRKRNLYLECVSHDDPLDQFFDCFFGNDMRYTPKFDKNGMYIPISHGPGSDSLLTCQIIQKVCARYGITCQPVFKNAGSYKYYVPYLTYQEARKINMLRPYVNLT